MQVKKFEAKTMKDALELVKTHLGPEAIILSAKDAHRGFGLMGERSVEVTAAVSEETLRKKKLAEAKMQNDLRERFRQIPAARQREFINRATRPRAAAPAPAPAPRPVAKPISDRRYIDIIDEEAAPARPVMRAPVAVSAPVAAPAPSAPAARPAEVIALENQVRELRALIERVQSLGSQPTSLHPGADFGLPFELSASFQRLTEQGVGSAVTAPLLRRAARELEPETLKTPALIEAWLARQLLDTITVTDAPIDQRYQVFVGTTGQGKTTTLVKLASHLVMRERRTIAMISLDTLKLGAAEQLRLYAQILNVPFAIVRSPEEWRVAEQKLGGVQHILVDCPGFSLRESNELDWLRRMLPAAELGRRVHYVQSILARDEEMMDLAARYQAVGFDDVIFTRLDESARQGAIVNFQDRFRVPLHSFATGTGVPEDFEFASPRRVVELLFKLKTGSL